MITLCTAKELSLYLEDSDIFKTSKSKRTDGFISTFSKYLVGGLEEGNGGREVC